MSSSYFRDAYQDQRLLKSHGFDAWPDAEELARYVFGLEEKVDALASMVDVDLGRDLRGDLIATRRRGES